MTQELSVVLIESFLLSGIIIPILYFLTFCAMHKNCAPGMNQRRNDYYTLELFCLFAELIC